MTNNLWLSVRRVMQGGAKNFVRGGAVTVATMIVMTVTLSIIGLLLFMSALLTFTLEAVREKVDININFLTTASEGEILAFADELRGLPEVAEVVYTTREQVLADFRASHQNDQLILQSLTEIGDNPFGASLGVRAKDPDQYEAIKRFLDDQTALSSEGASIIYDDNFDRNRETIARLSGAITATERTGLAIVILFSLASAIITFATIRLAIYSSRDEIGVMRLVGASNMYIRGPFIIAGVIAGVLSALITLLAFFPIFWYLGRISEDYLGGFNLFTYYATNFPWIFLVIVGSGILLGAVASYLAVRRYLRV